MVRLAALGILAGCGRLGFEDLERSAMGSADAAIDVPCGAVEQRTLACEAPLVGEITQQRTYDCANGGAWSPWSDVANNCAASLLRWAAVSAATGPFTSPLSISVGDTCSTATATSACSEPASGGMFWHFATCVCQ